MKFRFLTGVTVMTVSVVIAGFAGYAAVACWIVSVIPVRRIVPTKDAEVRVVRIRRNEIIISLMRKKRAGQNVDAKLQRWIEFDAKMNQAGK